MPRQSGRNRKSEDLTKFPRASQLWCQKAALVSGSKPKVLMLSSYLKQGATEEKYAQGNGAG
jgi:hypothetical protein